MARKPSHAKHHTISWEGVLSLAHAMRPIVVAIS